MVAGYHLIWTAYGYWLPNDPRGSTSREVRVEPIHQLGEIHYGRKTVQPSSAEIREFHDQARDLLKHPVLTFDADDVQLLAKAFGQVIAEQGYTCSLAPLCRITCISLFGGIATRPETTSFSRKLLELLLIAEGRRTATHPVWTKGPGWKRFLNTQQDFYRDIEYIRQNPIKIGWPEQVWDFVTGYDGWLPSFLGGNEEQVEGHANAKRIRLFSFSVRMALPLEKIHPIFAFAFPLWYNGEIPKADSDASNEVAHAISF